MDNVDAPHIGIIARIAVQEWIVNRMDDLISRLSELRCQYNCFDENERDAYHTLSEAIKALSDVPDTNVGDMISRQAAIKAFKNFLTIHDSRGVEYLCSAVTMDGVNKILSDLPSVERHGKWLDGYGFAGNYYDCFVCDQCKNESMAKTDYCPNCGARMD